jgi:putative transposase
VSRCRSFRFLLSPTSRQRVALAGLLEIQRDIYNAALEERRGAWRWERRSVTYPDQCQALTALRAADPTVRAAGVAVCRGTLLRLDRAFDAFFRRCQEGQNPGYPRFKSARRFESLQWEDRKGWRLDTSTSRVRLHCVGEVKVRLHRRVRGVPKAITVKREGRRWWVTIRCSDVPAKPLMPTGRQIGIDLGVRVLVATSDGQLSPNPAHGHRCAKQLAAAQHVVRSKQKGSKRRQRAGERVGAAYRYIRNCRRDALHQLSRQLVNDYDLIVHEDLHIENMVRRPKPCPDGKGGYVPNGAAAKTGLNRSIYDAGWGLLLAMITYKAEEAGRCIVVVDPRNTSRTCADCGHIAAGNRHDTEFRCQACGHEAHADTNAAINILRAGRAQQHTAAKRPN